MSLDRQLTSSWVRDFHQLFGYIAIGANAAAGIYGLAYVARRRESGNGFRLASWVALGAMAVQAVLGVMLYQRGTKPGSQHTFYGFVILFTLSFAYIYRWQLSKRPALRWGLLLLFVMGLGVRSVMTVSKSF